MRSLIRVLQERRTNGVWVCVCVCVCERGKERERRKKTDFYGIDSHYCRRLLFLKRVGQANRLEAQEELLLQLKSEGSLKGEPPFPPGSSVVFLLKISTDWIHPPALWRVIHSKSTDLHVNQIQTILCQQHLVWCLIKYLHTIA